MLSAPHAHGEDDYDEVADEEEQVQQVIQVSPACQGPHTTVHCTLYMYMYMYIRFVTPATSYMYIHIHVHMLCTRTCTHTHTRAHTHIHTHTHTHTHTHMQQVKQVSPGRPLSQAILLHAGVRGGNGGGKRGKEHNADRGGGRGKKPEERDRLAYDEVSSDQPVVLQPATPRQSLQDSEAGWVRFKFKTLPSK